MRSKSQWLLKRSYQLRILFHFCTRSRCMTHNLIRGGTIDLQHFEQDSSPGVKVVVNNCNITLTFPVNGRYNLES